MYSLWQDLSHHTIIFDLVTLTLKFDLLFKNFNLSHNLWMTKAPDVEKIHIDFCKKILGVKKSTCNSLVYYKLGRLPLYILRKLRIIKYWGKFKNSQNCILKSCLEERVNLKDDWMINVKTELCKLGLAYIWYEVYIDKRLYTIIEHRFYDVYSKKWCRIYTRCHVGILINI